MIPVAHDTEWKIVRKALPDMRSKRRKRIVRYRRPLNINIGVIIFTVVFIYITVTVFIYLTREKVSIYEVTTGNHEKQSSFQVTGLALREEVVSASPVAGYINYYVKEGTRVALDTTLYSIDESGTVTQLMKETAQNNAILTKDNLQTVRTEIQSYITSYSDMNYCDAYSFRYRLNAALIDLVYLNSIESINQMLSANGNQTFIINPSASTGIVEFYTDGYEAVTPDTFTEDMFDQSQYHRTEVHAGDIVQQGAPIYKTVNNENWWIVIPLTEQQAIEYSDITQINIELVDEDIQTTGLFSIRQVGTGSYGMISLKRHMMNCAGKRFIKLRVVGDSEEGLKIPVSSVTEKDFFVVPKEYWHPVGDDNNMGFSRQVPGENTIEPVVPDVYYTDDSFCYVDPKGLAVDDVLVLEDSMARYVVGITRKLKGVYNVNTGYTLFRRIEILSQKGEYYILKKDTPFGLSVFDRIVLNASLVKDGTIIFH